MSDSLRKNMLNLMADHFNELPSEASDRVIADHLAIALNALCDVTLLTVTCLEDESVDEVLDEMVKKVKKMHIECVSDVDKDNP